HLRHPRAEEPRPPGRLPRRVARQVLVADRDELLLRQLLAQRRVQPHRAAPAQRALAGHRHGLPPVAVLVAVDAEERVGELGVLRQHDGLEPGQAGRVAEQVGGLVPAVADELHDPRVGEGAQQHRRRVEQVGAGVAEPRHLAGRHARAGAGHAARLAADVRAEPARAVEHLPRLGERVAYHPHRARGAADRRPPGEGVDHVGHAGAAGRQVEPRRPFEGAGHQVRARVRGADQEHRPADLDAVDHEDVGRKSHRRGKCDTVSRVIETPGFLHHDATVAVVAPSGPVDAAALRRGVERLEGLGMKVVVGQHVFDRQDLPYLAGTDAARAADLQAAWCDPAVSAVFCARGGYGAGRLLPLLDWDAMRAAGPKVLVGSSDITALHRAFAVELGVPTLHGPMPGSALLGGEEGPEPDTLAHLRAALTGAAAPVTGDRVLVPGRAEGVLSGGNLSLLASLCGTRYQPSFAGGIAFLEDIGEEPYRVDRMLTQLLQ